MKNTLPFFWVWSCLLSGYFPDPNSGIKKIGLIAAYRKNNGTTNKNEPIKKVKCLLTIKANVLESINWILTQILNFGQQEERADYSWSAVLYKLYSEVFAKSFHILGIPVLYVVANWWRRPCCYMNTSRETAVMLRRACNNICLFRKHVVSVFQVYTYCIKCETFQFASLPKMYLISETKAEPDHSFVWDELVRYKWAYKSMWVNLIQVTLQLFYVVCVFKHVASLGICNFNE